MKLHQATVLITGASSGIGAAIAKELAPQVGALILIARREERLLALKPELKHINSNLKVLTIPCDVTDHRQVDAMLARVSLELGAVDILINNAGMGDIGFFASSDWPKLEQMIHLNILSLTYLTRKLVGPMITRRQGGILMVGSTAGLQATPTLGTYSATKYYVNGFTQALRAELKSSNITVTQLCPGPVATEFLSLAQGNQPPMPHKFFEISAEQCAHEAVEGFKKGRAVIIPGRIPRLILFIHSLMPQICVRYVLGIVAARAAKF